MLGFGTDTPGLMIAPSNFSQFDLENFEHFVNNSVALVKVFGDHGASELRKGIFKFYLDTEQPVDTKNFSDYLTQYNKVGKFISY